MIGPIAPALLSRLRRNPAVARLLDRFDEIALPDCWIVAGCLAQTLWNLDAGAAADAGIRDIDIVYHDPTSPPRPRRRTKRGSAGCSPILARGST